MINLQPNLVLAKRIFENKSDVLSTNTDKNQRCLAEVIQSNIKDINKGDKIAFKDRYERDFYYDGIDYIILTREVIFGIIND